MKVIFFNQLPIDIITTINQFIPKKNCDYCSKILLLIIIIIFIVQINVIFK